jgi:hypothetical protein
MVYKVDAFDLKHDDQFWLCLPFTWGSDTGVMRGASLEKQSPGISVYDSRLSEDPGPLPDRIHEGVSSYLLIFSWFLLI